MRKKRTETTVTVVCYGITKQFRNQKQAEDFFWDCADESEGAERERYMSIISQLRKGKTYCSDEER